MFNSMPQPCLCSIPFLSIPPYHIPFHRLLRLKRRYRDLMNTMVALTPRLLSVCILIIIIYYAFSIIGMEFLYDTVRQGCCNSSWYDAELYYSGIMDSHLSPNDTNTPYVFYLNNFDNIYRSYGEERE